MSASSMFDKASFWSLPEKKKDAIRRFTDMGTSDRERLGLGYSNVFSHRKSVSASLEYFSLWLEKIIPASFEFMHPYQKAVCEEELRFAFCVFFAQYQLDSKEHRSQCLKERREQIERCARYINELRLSTKPATCDSLLSQAISDSDKPVKYLGLTLIAPKIADMMVDMVSGLPEDMKASEETSQTQALKGKMGDVNAWRLYWVWAGNLLSTVIGLLPDSFSNIDSALDVVRAPAPVTGYMSWVLYYARFGINLSLLLKHTITGPWMDEAERKIPAWERFKTQWEQRKFSLLNDSIWATANLACFFWLVGSGTLGFWGNVVTAGLLLMDIGLTALRFYEESTRYNINRARYLQDINEIQAKIAAKRDEDDEKKRLLFQLSELEKAKNQCDFDWRYKKYNTINDLVYASGLMVSFTAMCGAFIPEAILGETISLSLGVGGAAFCFVFTVAYAAVSGGLEIAKSKATRASAKKEYEACLGQFLEAQDELVKKQLYLEMKRLMSQSDYQDRLIEFQAMKLARSVFIQALIPPLMFASLLFLPLGIGLGVLAAGFVISVLTNVLLKRFEPKPDDLPTFKVDEYDAFVSLHSASSKDKKTNLSLLGFHAPIKDTREGLPLIGGAVLQAGVTSF